MTAVIAVGWGLLGVAAGLGVNRFSRWLAGIESRGLSPEERIVYQPTGWQQWLEPALAGIFFFLFAWRLGFGLLLLIDSVYVLILVQVFAFDLNTRLILDLVILPGCAVALILSFITPWTPALSWPGPDWRTAAVAGVATAAVFALLVLVATLIYGPEGMGIGDIKLALFIGLATGLTDFRVVRAILLGVFLGGFVAILLVVTRIRKMRQAIPYGPFLVLGTLITLLVQRP
ncbi:MAG TPA: A24 family peptidase [Candidatus Dormibacteraeota bacterium]|nr:A24 family peptidase [Candidatus Dormibacteraeota bacterium]